jgi:hypothetical protein
MDGLTLKARLSSPGLSLAMFILVIDTIMNVLITA